MAKTQIQCIWNVCTSRQLTKEVSKDTTINLHVALIIMGIVSGNIPDMHLSWPFKMTGKSKEPVNDIIDLKWKPT